MRFFKKSLYLIIPLAFFAIWYFAVAFVDYEFNPENMKTGVRIIIVWFGLPLSILGLYFAYLINKN